MGTSNSLEIRDECRRLYNFFVFCNSSIFNTFDPPFHLLPWGVFGSCTATHKLPHTTASSTIYVKYPPKMSFLIVKAKSDAAAAGPTVLWIETTVCARPFVAPRDRLLGAAEHTYMSTEPYNLQRSFCMVNT